MGAPWPWRLSSCCRPRGPWVGVGIGSRLRGFATHVGSSGVLEADAAQHAASPAPAALASTRGSKEEVTGVGVGGKDSSVGLAAGEGCLGAARLSSLGGKQQSAGFCSGSVRVLFSQSCW